MPSLKEKIAEWYIKYNVSRQCYQSLLNILKGENLEVPGNPDSLFKRERVMIRTCAPGHYWHYGIKKQLAKYSAEELLRNCIRYTYIYRLPLYESSQQGLWPILSRIVNVENCAVFLIGTYCGPSKPYYVDTYLHAFITEIKDLFNDGFLIGNKNLPFKIRAFVCDAPAGAYIRGITAHNSLHGCNKCDQVGKSIEKVVTFAVTSANLITDEDFINRKYNKLHKKNFISQKLAIENVGLGMITQFPLDCMHLIDLGVTKKILMRIFKEK